MIGPEVLSEKSICCYKKLHIRVEMIGPEVLSEKSICCYKKLHIRVEMTSFKKQYAFFIIHTYIYKDAFLTTQKKNTY